MGFVNEYNYYDDCDTLGFAVDIRDSRQFVNRQMLLEHLDPMHLITINRFSLKEYAELGPNVLKGVTFQSI